MSEEAVGYAVAGLLLIALTPLWVLAVRVWWFYLVKSLTEKFR